MNHGPLSPQIAAGLAVLRDRIAAADIPSSKLDETITIATWNIRELGAMDRQEASLHFIAEIIGQFDLVSVVELRDNTSDLAKVLALLGPYWKAVFSDYLVGPGGKRERSAFVYDSRAVTFTGLASQAIALRTKDGTEYEPEITWWRPPYIASFRSGSFDFILVAAHIRWGDTDEGRIQELLALADWVDAKSKEEFIDDHDIIVVGDFHIPSVDSPLYAAITSKGLRMPAALAAIEGIELAKGKRYDQILHNPSHAKNFTNIGGVLDFYQGDPAPLYPGQMMTKAEFTFQVSNHLPLWMHVNTDSEGKRPSRS
jgi:hypothetical protein